MSGKHAQPIDPGPSAVLDLSELTVPEIATLMVTIREAYLSAEYAHNVKGGPKVLWTELYALYLELRQAFLPRFFEVV